MSMTATRNTSSMTIPPQLNKRQSQPLSLRKESPNTMLPPPSKILHRKESAICNNTASTSLLLPGKDTSSSAGKVFARPSKEWVLPERAKPGRKLSVESPDNVRQSQNRISQRAHRARKTDYVQTLEDKIKAYEADEIHSNVRLQEVARALKADNESLKAENNGFRGRLAEVELERQRLASARDEEVRSLREEIVFLKSGSLSQVPIRQTSISEKQTIVETPMDIPLIPKRKRSRSTTQPSLACPICPDPDPDCPCQQPLPTATISHITPKPSSSDILISTTSTTSTKCGLCETTDECFCSIDHSLISSSSRSPPIPTPAQTDTTETCGLCMTADFCACRDVVDIASSKIVPPVSAAVPLRSRIRRSDVVPIWRVDSSEAICTGDPGNCEVCRNDSFGQEFCARLVEATSHSGNTSQIHQRTADGVTRCATCPGNCMAISSIIDHSSDSNNNPEESTFMRNDTSSLERAEGQETMRFDQAWKAIKAHPNADVSSLAMLAEVVARRTKCLGPRVELSPPPEQHEGSMREASAGKAVKRRLEVEAGGVRDALRLLDGGRAGKATRTG